MATKQSEAKKVGGWVWICTDGVWWMPEGDEEPSRWHGPIGEFLSVLIVHLIDLSRVTFRVQDRPLFED